jgi:hypothetical protein
VTRTHAKLFLLLAALHTLIAPGLRGSPLAMCTGSCFGCREACTGWRDRANTRQSAARYVLHQTDSQILLNSSTCIYIYHCTSLKASTNVLKKIKEREREKMGGWRESKPDLGPRSPSSPLQVKLRQLCDTCGNLRGLAASNQLHDTRRGIPDGHLVCAAVLYSAFIRVIQRRRLTFGFFWGPRPKSGHGPLGSCASPFPSHP